MSEEDQTVLDEKDKPHKLELRDKIVLSVLAVVASLCLTGAHYSHRLNDERERKSWKEFDSTKGYSVKVTESENRSGKSCVIRQRDGNIERLVIAVDSNKDNYFDGLKLINVPKDHDLMRYASFDAMVDLYARAKEGFKKEGPKRVEEIAEPDYTQCDLDYFPGLADKNK
jgi:hypothetical protein